MNKLDKQLFWGQIGNEYKLIFWSNRNVIYFNRDKDFIDVCMG